MRTLQIQPDNHPILVRLFFLGPAFTGLALFMIAPFILAIMLSFTNQRLMSPEPTQFVGLRNYERLLGLHIIIQKATIKANGSKTYPRLRTVLRKNEDLKGYRELTSLKLDDKKYVLVARDKTFWTSIYNIGRFVIMVLPLQLGLALGMALLINRSFKGRVFFRTLFFAPVVTSMVVVSILWIYLYSQHNGMINEMLKVLTFGQWENRDFLSNPNLAMPAIVVMSAWQGAGFQMLIFLASLQNISQDLYEAAEIDGANSWQKFRNVTVPGLKNTFTFIIISTTLAAFTLFVQVDVMTKGGPLDSTTTIMFHAIKKGFIQQDIAYASTISVVYFVFLLFVAWGQKTYLDKK